MQVYKITPTIVYSWGCALVAANNREEAIKVYKDDDEQNAREYNKFREVCNVVDKLTYDCIEPTVILDTIGAE